MKMTFLITRKGKVCVQNFLPRTRTSTNRADEYWQELELPLVGISFSIRARSSKHRRPYMRQKRIEELLPNSLSSGQRTSKEANSKLKTQHEIISH